ncbi:MAG: hypothetical protein ACRYHA_21315 [Janthinobacterium lividum]
MIVGHAVAFYPDLDGLSLAHRKQARHDDAGVQAVPRVSAAGVERTTALIPGLAVAAGDARHGDFRGNPHAGFFKSYVDRTVLSRLLKTAREIF